MAVRLSFPLLLLLAAWGSVSHVASAAERDLDPTFGDAGNGRVTLGIDAGVSDIAAQIVEAGDGSIYVVGTTPPGIGIVRVSANGLPDTQFGAVRYPLDNAQYALTATTAVLDLDGGLVVGGHYVTVEPAAGPFWFACRFDADGTPDPGFGDGLIAPGCTTDFATGTGLRGEVRDMVMQPSGRLVFAGYVLDDADKERAALSSLAANGAPDTLFSDDGVGEANMVVPFPAVVPQSRFNAISLGMFSDLLAVGDYRIADGNSDILVTRLTGFGTPFQGFGTNGSVIHAVDLGPPGAQRDVGNAVVITLQNAIAVAGSAELSAAHRTAGLVLWLKPNGAIDTNLGNNGLNIAESDGVAIRFNAATRAPEGRIVLAGAYTSKAEEQSSVALVTRANADGNFDDEGFGDTAFEFVPSNGIDDANYSAVVDVLIQDDRILVAGSSRILGQDDIDFAVARIGDRRLFGDGFESIDAP